jgi:hypothetical protein
MYANWSKLPSEGYELMPDYFWVWDENNKVNIVETMPDTSPYPKPIVGGNLWGSYWKKHKNMSRKNLGDVYTDRANACQYFSFGKVTVAYFCNPSISC